MSPEVFFEAEDKIALGRKTLILSEASFTGSVKEMELEKQYRLRVQNCIGTIIDVHKSISIGSENQDFLSRFETLKHRVEELDMSLISEGDILMVEKATNALLEEFKAIFAAGELKPLDGRDLN